MKPTIKISIAGYAFHLDEDAYSQLDNYLISLREYFKNNEDGAEIISDVETRISELLRLKIGKNVDRVISIQDIDEITGMIGSPKDMDDSAETDREGDFVQNKTSSLKKKKLFRDNEHALLGGVCSGLGQYFSLDPVIIRAIYILAFVLLGFIFGEIRTALVIGYFVLWIIMPKAKTMKQKVQMMGANPSIDNIENREGVTFSRERSSTLLKVVKIVAGIILGLISFSLLLSVMAVLGVFFGISAVQDMPTANEVLSIFSINTFGVKLSLILIAILPILALFYWTVKLLFQLRFTKKDLIISFIAFFLWIGVGCYLGGFIAMYVKDFSEEATAIEAIPLETKSDKIYVKFGDNYAGLKPLYLVSDSKSHRENAVAHFHKDNKGVYSLTILPRLVVETDSSLKNVVVEIKKEAYSDSHEGAVQKAENAKLNYTVQDSLLIINPVMYSKRNPWDRVIYKIVVKTPPDKSIIGDGLPTKYRN